jgi:hypothetical protein
VTVFQIVAQVPIVQFGGQVFGTTSLEAYQWGICIGLGAGSWPLGLFLRCIHSHHLPKSFGIFKDLVPVHERQTRGRELWIRGVARLRTHIRVVSAFRQGLQQSQSMRHLKQDVAAV